MVARVKSGSPNSSSPYLRRSVKKEKERSEIAIGIET
jgi:hypothetical protein